MPFGIFNKKTAADLNNQGIAHWEKSKFDDAIRDFDKSIEIDPRYAFAWSNKGGVLNDLHKYDDALLAVDKAIEIDPTYAKAWFIKGTALRNQGKNDEALKAIDRAIELDPKLAAAQNVKKLITEKPDEAQSSADTWNNKGVALANQGKYDEALQAFDKAIELNPKFALAWSNRALMLSKQNNYDEALKTIDRAIELDPKLAAAQNVKKLITNSAIAKILQKRCISPNDVLIAVEGGNGQIILTDKGIIIGREGGLGTKIVVGFTRGEKFLPYRNITGIQFKEPGRTVGYIQFTLPGGIESRGGVLDAVKDENTITFGANQLESFRKIRDIVEERQGLGTIPTPHIPTPQMPPRSSIVDELTKLAALKRDGAINEEEYAQLKKDLLSNH
jgi:tetratricopeptide (TPR) repeat protein